MFGTFPLISRSHYLIPQNYIDAHPDVAVFDPIRGVRLLMDRKSECTLVAQSDIVRRGTGGT